MKTLSVLILLVIPLFCISQSYEIQSFQDSYEPLSNANSILEEEEGFPIWGRRFDLEFEFPFFDQSYTHLECERRSVCSFDSFAFAIRLLAYGYQADFADFPFETPLDSDVLYTHVEKDGMNAFVIEYRNNRLDSDDPSVDMYDTFINFQTWFYENGNLEIRFGDKNLTNSDVYTPGEGFSLQIPAQDTAILLGPEVTLVNPDNENEIVSFDGAFDNFNQVNQFGSILTLLPPSGWVIRFQKDISNNTLDITEKKTSFYIDPSIGQLSADFKSTHSGVLHVYNLCGKQVDTKNFDHLSKIETEINHLASGFYVCRIFFDDGTFSKAFKFVI